MFNRLFESTTCLKCIQLRLLFLIPILLHCIMYLDLSNKLGFWAQIPKPTPDPPLFASCEQSPEQWTQINPPAFSAQPGNSTSILQVFGQSLIFLSVQHFGNRHHWKKLDIVNLKWLQLGSITKALIVLRLHTMLGCQEDLMPVASMWPGVTICAQKVLSNWTTCRPACWRAPWIWSRSRRHRSCQWWRRTCPCLSFRGSQSAALLCLSPSCQPEMNHEREASKRKGWMWHSSQPQNPGP